MATQTTVCYQSCCIYYNPFFPGQQSCACADVNTCWHVQGNPIYSCYYGAIDEICVMAISFVPEEGNKPASWVAISASITGKTATMRLQPNFPCRTDLAGAN